jgi:hypothetical protein
MPNKYKTTKEAQEAAAVYAIQIIERDHHNEEKPTLSEAEEALLRAAQRFQTKGSVFQEAR